MGKGHSSSSSKNKRDPMISYRNKIARIKKWYERLLKFRETAPEINPHNKLPYKRAELKDLQYYIDQIKKPKV